MKREERKKKREEGKERRREGEEWKMELAEVLPRARPRSSSCFGWESRADASSWTDVVSGGRSYRVQLYLVTRNTRMRDIAPVRPAVPPHQVLTTPGGAVTCHGNPVLGNLHVRTTTRRDAPMRARFWCDAMPVPSRMIHWRCQSWWGDWNGLSAARWGGEGQLLPGNLAGLCSLYWYFVDLIRLCQRLDSRSQSKPPSKVHLC